jgi:type I restriction enzyme S subunit
VLLAEDGGHFDDPDRGIAYAITGKSWVNNHAHVLRPRNRIEMRFLCRVLENYDIRSHITGTTRGKLTKAGASRIRIPLPPLDAQRRIAAILDKADSLRQKRRIALQKLDSLTQSIFLDMFGDPAWNPKRFPCLRLGDLASRFSDGPFGSNLKSEHYKESGIRVIRLQNIGVNELLDDDKAYISETHASSLEKHECLPGDILVGTLGNPNLRACIQPEWISKAINKADCVQIRVKDGTATAEFLATMLNIPSVEMMASGLIHGQTRSRIAMGKLRELIVPIPPFSSQQEFSIRCNRVEAARSITIDDLRQTNALFASLQHRAFRGEL